MTLFVVDLAPFYSVWIDKSLSAQGETENVATCIWGECGLSGLRCVLSRIGAVVRATDVAVQIASSEIYANDR